MAARSTRAARCSARRGGAGAAARRRASRTAIVGALALPLGGIGATPARAEIGFDLTVASDDRFRGESTSAGRPVATLGLSYDDASGLYAGASITAGPTGRDGVRPLRSIQYGGYTRGIAPGVAIDVGVTNRVYTRDATIEYARRFAQLYVGLVGRRVSARLFVAPGLGRDGGAAQYVEVEGPLWSRESWSLTARLGALHAPREDRGDHPVVVDARISLARRLGRAAISLSAIAATPGDTARTWRNALVLQLSRSF